MVTPPAYVDEYASFLCGKLVLKRYGKLEKKARVQRKQPLPPCSYRAVIGSAALPVHCSERCCTGIITSRRSCWLL
jgi:hypothetical protein